MTDQLTLAQTRIIDPILSTHAQGYRNSEFVGMDLFPTVPVTLHGGQIIEFGREHFRLYNTSRAPGSAVKSIQFGYLGKPFALLLKSLAGKLPYEHMVDAAQVPGINLGQRAVNMAMKALQLELEVDCANLARDATKYDANHKVVLAGAAKWSDPNSTPSTDFENAREAIRSSVGMYPNMALIGAKAFSALKHHPKVTDRFKHVSKESITADMIASLFELRKVSIGKAIYLNDQEQPVDIWGTDVIFAYVPEQSSGMEDPSYGYTYTMTGHPYVEEPYQDRTHMSWMYPVTYNRTPVLSGITSGFLIQGAA